VRDAATDLRQVLANGPMAATDIKKATDAASHSWRTVTRAAERLGIMKRPIRREGGFGVEAWEWALPTVFDYNELMRHAGVIDQ
jgi:putative DNA primase/helicase